MNVTTLLIIILVLILLGGLPVWPYSAGLGWGPSGLVGVILVIVVVVLLLYWSVGIWIWCFNGAEYLMENEILKARSARVLKFQYGIGLLAVSIVLMRCAFYLPAA